MIFTSSNEQPNKELTIDDIVNVMKELQMIKPLPPPLRIAKSFAIQKTWKQVKFPKSKKKRIRKKWKKNQANYGYIETAIHDKKLNVVYVSEEVFDKIKDLKPIKYK